MLQLVNGALDDATRAGREVEDALFATLDIHDDETTCIGDQQLARTVPAGLHLTNHPLLHLDHVATAVKKGGSLLQLPRSVEVVDVDVVGLDGSGRFRVLLLRSVASVVEVEYADALCRHGAGNFDGNSQMLSTLQKVVLTVVTTRLIDVVENGRRGHQTLAVGDEGDLRVDRGQELVGSDQVVQNGTGGRPASKGSTIPTEWK